MESTSGQEINSVTSSMLTTCCLLESSSQFSISLGFVQAFSGALIFELRTDNIMDRPSVFILGYKGQLSNDLVVLQHV